MDADCFDIFTTNGTAGCGQQLCMPLNVAILLMLKHNIADPYMK